MAVPRALEQAVSFLEAHLQRWPSQWLNFYDFWPRNGSVGCRRAGAHRASGLDEECIMPRRAAVAVTGIGAISPYGLGWEALLEGLSVRPERDPADLQLR